MNAFTLVDPVLFWFDPFAAIIGTFVWVHYCYPMCSRLQNLGIGMCLAGLVFQGVTSWSRVYGIPVDGLVWLWAMKDFGIIAFILGTVFKPLPKMKN